jgi:hypothetical protein
MKTILLAPDPIEGGDNKPADKPADKPAAPATPAEVKKTPLKTPNEIRLEKEVATLRDELDGFKGWRDEVNASLETLQIGKPSSVPVNKSTTPPASLSETIERDIWGN